MNSACGCSRLALALFCKMGRSVRRRCTSITVMSGHLSGDRLGCGSSSASLLQGKMGAISRVCFHTAWGFP